MSLMAVYLTTMCVELSGLLNIRLKNVVTASVSFLGNKQRKHLIFPKESSEIQTENLIAPNPNSPLFPVPFNVKIEVMDRDFFGQLPTLNGVGKQPFLRSKYRKQSIDHSRSKIASNSGHNKYFGFNFLPNNFSKFLNNCLT